VPSSKIILRTLLWYMVNTPSEVRVLLNLNLITIPPSIVIFIQAASSYSNRLALTATLDRLTMNCLQNEAIFCMEELIGAVEHVFVFYPRYEWMGDSFFHMTVITDGHWVNQLVGEDAVPRFRFYDDSDSMWEARNHVMDFDGNNDKENDLLPSSISNVIFVFCSGLLKKILRKVKEKEGRGKLNKRSKRKKSKG